MQKTTVRNKRFTVSVFTMDYEETLSFKEKDISRNMPLPKLFNTMKFNERVMQQIIPLYSIPIVVKGKFVVTNASTFYAEPNLGDILYLPKSGKDVKAMAMRDGSEYHWLVPRGKEPPFWERLTARYAADVCVPILTDEKERYLYVATGSLKRGNRVIPAKSFLRIPPNKYWEYWTTEESIVVNLWQSENQ